MSVCSLYGRGSCASSWPLQAQVDENLKKQAELMSVIDRETAAYKHAFGYTEWRSACEVSRL